MAHLNRTRLLVVGLLVSLSTASHFGCGLDQYGLPPDNATGSNTGSGGTAGEGGQGGMAGAAGMAGMGGGMGCVPDATRSCYSGTPATANIGTCKPGIETCLANGLGYGPCVGEVLPTTTEDCVTAGDQDCDTFDDADDPECVCTMAGAVVACDTGMPGVCAMGMGVCAADGRSISNCAPTAIPSAENCATVEDDDCDGLVTLPCSGDPNWTYAPAGATMAPNDDMVFSVAATADGGYVIAGVVDGTIAGDGYGVTAGSVYVAKIDAMGVPAWPMPKIYPVSTFGAARGVAVDKDGKIIVVGEFQGTVQFDGVNNNTSATGGHTDLFLLQLDSNGQYLWHKIIGVGNHQAATDVATDAMGNIVITGFVTNDDISFGGTTFDPDNDDVFVAKFASNGMHIWSKVHINPSSQKGRSIAVANNGDVVIIGDASNNINLGGTGTLMNGGNVDFFIARYDGVDGTHKWSKIFGKAGDQIGRDVAVAPDGNVLITGAFTGAVDWKMGTTMMAAGGTTDVYLAKLKGDDGTYLMHTKGSAGGVAVGTSVAADASGNITLFGNFVGPLDFGGQPNTSFGATSDTFLVKLKVGDWAPIWTKPFGKAANQFGWAMTVANDGSAVVGGGFYNELDIPPNVMSIKSTGGSDLFAVSTKP